MTLQQNYRFSYGTNVERGMKTTFVIECTRGHNIKLKLLVRSGLTFVITHVAHAAHATEVHAAHTRHTGHARHTTELAAHATHTGEAAHTSKVYLTSNG